MFLGHFGIGFGAKAAAPRASLGTLFLAAQFVDLLWPTVLLLGVEHVAISPGVTRVTPLDFTDYPITHSLLAVVVWGVIFGGIYYLLRRNRRGAWVCGAAVVSHWLLDLLVHRPDLPLAPWMDFRAGFGIWNSMIATLGLEFIVLAIGITLYCRTTRASDRIGSIGLWALVGFLVLAYLGSVFGQPPPNVFALAWVGQSQWLLVLWGFWVDRHREASRQKLGVGSHETGAVD